MLLRQLLHCPYGPYDAGLCSLFLIDDVDDAFYTLMTRGMLLVNIITILLLSESLSLMIPRSVLIKSRKLLCKNKNDNDSTKKELDNNIESNNNDDVGSIIVKDIKKKKKGSVKNSEQLRGQNANVYWRSVKMDDLRQHPLFEPLPTPETVSITSSESLQLFRQDSIQWSLLHKGRLTTSKAGACLGLYETESAEFLRVPRSLIGHQRVLSAFDELKDEPIDWKSLTVEVKSLNETSSAKSNGSSKLWRPATYNASSSSYFPYTYHPDVRSIKVVRGISTASTARMCWGQKQEATAILAAINYFSVNQNSSVHGVRVREVGLLPLESVAEAAVDDDIYSIGIENSQRIKGFFDSKSLPLLGASPDGLIVYDDGHTEVLEVKNSSPFFAGRPNKQGTNRLQVNKSGFQFKGLGVWFVPQLQLEILCAGRSCTSAILIQLSATSGAVCYKVERDNEYIALMLEWLKEFYTTFVLHDKEPEENFMNSINKEKYIEFLKYTRKISENSKLISHIPQDQIQRSHLNTNFFC